MRKKRKQAGKAAEAQAIAVELECPEIVEALEAREVARELADQPGVDGPAADAAEPADEAAWADEVEAMEASAAGEGEGPADADADADAAPVVTELSPERLESIIESLLFAGDRPVSLRDFRSLTGERNLGKIEAALAVITERFAARGIVLHDVAGGFQFRTHPANSEYVQRLIAGRPVRLSRAQLETLAIVAYRQPITRPEIDEIRGVDSGSTLKILLDRDLIRILGKKEEPGRPLLYGTTKEFLEFFHLKDLREMPTLREFHELSEDSLREVDRHDQERDDEGAGAADDSDRSASSVESSTIDQTGEPYEAEPAGTATVALDATLGDDLDDAGDAS